MVRPSAAIASASSRLSKASAAWVTAGGNATTELSAATAMKAKANQGTAMRWRRAPAGCRGATPRPPPRATQADSSTRKGASIITRTILAITAASPACWLTAVPAATTCATSCTVEPVKSP